MNEAVQNLFRTLVVAGLISAGVALSFPLPAQAADDGQESIAFFFWDIPNDAGLFGLSKGIVYTSRSGAKTYIYGLSDQGYAWPLDLFDRADPTYRLGVTRMHVSQQPPQPVLGTKTVAQSADLSARFEKLKAAAEELTGKSVPFAFLPNPANAHPVDAAQYKVIERDGVRVIVSKAPTERLEVVFWDIPGDEDRFGLTGAIRYVETTGRTTYLFGKSSLAPGWPAGFLKTAGPDYQHGQLVLDVTQTPPAKYFSSTGVIATGHGLLQKFVQMIEYARQVEALKLPFAYLPTEKQGNGNAILKIAIEEAGYDLPELKSLFYQ